MADEPNLPTEQQMQAGAEVVEAGETAAAAEPDPEKKRAAAGRAIRREAKSKGWELTPEQADMLAGMVAAKLAEKMDGLPDRTADKIAERGGYDRLPEPLTHPPATGQGTIPAEPPAAPVTDEKPGEGRTRGVGSFARWYRRGDG